jgi:hypothetical protein
VYAAFRDENIYEIYGNYPADNGVSAG